MREAMTQIKQSLADFIANLRWTHIVGGAMLLIAGVLAATLLGPGAGVDSGSSLTLPIADKTTDTATKGQSTAKAGEHAPLQHMQLEAQYAGPLKDTLIQRWRDPVDGRICYIYLPVVVQHSQPTPVGAVQYGANTIGSISCSAPTGK